MVSQVRQWLLDPGSISNATAAWTPEPFAQQRLVARAAQIARQWSKLPPARTRSVLAALIERVGVRVDQVEVHLRPAGLSALFDAAVTPSLGEEIVILAVPARLRRAGIEIRMLIDGTDPFAVFLGWSSRTLQRVHSRRFRQGLCGWVKGLPASQRALAGLPEHAVPLQATGPDWSGVVGASSGVTQGHG